MKPYKNYKYIAYDPSTQELGVRLSSKSANHYPVDLERCRNSAQMLNWIFQLNSKPWATAEIIKEFLEAVEDICRDYHDSGAQGVFCAFGKDRRVDWGT